MIKKIMNKSCFILKGPDASIGGRSCNRHYEDRFFLPARASSRGRGGQGSMHYRLIPIDNESHMSQKVEIIGTIRQSANFEKFQLHFATELGLSMLRELRSS